jgi:hypothetical protein
MADIDDEGETATETPRDKFWSIRSMPPREREDAAAAARRAGMSVAEWLAQAIRTQLMVERGELTWRHPDDAEPPKGDPKGKAGAAVAPSSGSSPALDALTELERLAAVAAKVCEATQKPLPRAVSRLLYSEVRLQMLMLGHGGGATTVQALPAPD